MLLAHRSHNMKSTTWAVSASLAFIAVSVSVPPAFSAVNNHLCGDFCPTSILQGNFPGDEFGTAVIPLGTNGYVIGAPGERSFDGLYTGRIYLYSIEGGLLGSRYNPRTNSQDGFSSTLAPLDESRFLVGAPIGTEVVYIYNAAGSRIMTITNPAPYLDTLLRPKSSFGRSIATVGTNLIVVGSPTYSYPRLLGDPKEFRDYEGRAYLFNTNGTLIKRIESPVRRRFEFFGTSVAKAGNHRFLISAPTRVSDEGITLPGSVHLYHIDGTLLRTFRNPNPPTLTPRPGFGQAMADLGEGRLVITAPDNDIITLTSTNPAAGMAYLYDYNGQLLRTIPNPYPGSNYHFGASVTKVGTNAFAIGQNNTNTVGTVIDTVYFYNFDGDLLATLRKGNDNTADSFGVAVAGVGEDWLVAGAPKDDNPGANDGAAYLYYIRLPEYYLGQEIPRPPTLALADVPANGPEIHPPDAAYWHRSSLLEAKLYATKVGKVTIKWTPELTVQAFNLWPTNDGDYQVHIANTPPVDITDGGRFTHAQAMYADPGAAVNPQQVEVNRQFQASGAGKSLLMLSTGDPKVSPIYFQLIKSVTWDTPAVLVGDKQVPVGTEITNFFGFHNSACGGPFVYWPNSYYCADDGYYHRVTRTGPIIPVNEDRTGVDEDDFVLILYQTTNSLREASTQQRINTSIGWPYKPVRYKCQWPTEDASGSLSTNIIANICEKEVIDPFKYVDWDIYVQNDPAKPGFNPNDEHAVRASWNGGEAIFPLRDDLGSTNTSLPYVLMKYRSPANSLKPMIKVFKVVATNAAHQLHYHALAGSQLNPPFPLSLFQTESEGFSGRYWQDRKGTFYAYAAGDDGGTSNVVMHYRYPMQPTFYLPGTNPPTVGTLLPWLDSRAATPNTPINVTFTVYWPDSTNRPASTCGLPTNSVPELRIAETVVKPKNELPDFQSQSSAEIVYQQAESRGQISVLLIDPTRERTATLTNLPPDIPTVNEGGLLLFPTLPPHLRDRFFFDPLNYKLKFRGQFVEPPIGEYYLLLNYITERERALLSQLAANSTQFKEEFLNAVTNLAANLIEVPPQTTNGFDTLALTAGAATGTGYVVVAFGNHTNLSAPGEPISLEVIKVTCPLYKGEIKTILSDNAFDEKLTLRHSGDFAGRAAQYLFHWYYRSPETSGAAPPAPNNDQIKPAGWTSFAVNTNGALDITIEGPGLTTLIDQYFICRYEVTDATLVCSNRFSDWTEPKLAEGWIKRVLRAIDPFEQRIKQYRNNQVNTIVSMIGQAGAPWAGNVALNAKAANNFGLIELYQTILNRGLSLSIEGSPAVIGNPDVDSALLLAAGRIADLYMLLGNEAYADAADPTIAFGTDGVYGAETASIHCFMNQTATLLEEELALLRGRDSSKQPGVQKYPVYNRLVWNFTRDITGGEVAYALNYNLRNENGDVTGNIDEADAKVLYPQGHGDAWGHYLSAIKGYYRLLRHPNYVWVSRAEAVEVGGVDVSVDYLDERKFAVVAAAKARTGAEIVNLTYRDRYVEDPDGHWQGYRDIVLEPKSENGSAENAAAQPEPRAWGLYDWAARAGQGALFDWAIANALLPPLQTNLTGIQRVDRTTVPELREIPAVFQEIQAKLDAADHGLNPLGLTGNSIPFDIDPALASQGSTHYEQIQTRAVMALNNAIAVFNHANNSTQLLRRQADSVSDFQIGVTEREADFNSRLIEVFGYPYDDDIGPAGSYPSGYAGPDLLHYDYFDPSELLGIKPPPVQVITGRMFDFDVNESGALITNQFRDVAFNVSEHGFGLIKPTAWTGRRRALGEIQIARSEVIQTKARFEKAMVDYDNLINQIEEQAALLQAQYDLTNETITVMNSQRDTVQSLNRLLFVYRSVQVGLQTAARVITLFANATAEALPKVIIAGTASGGDMTSVPRGALLSLGTVASEVASTAADGTGLLIFDKEQEKELLQLSTSLQLETLRNEFAIKQAIAQLEQLVRQGPALRLELYTLFETLEQASGRYMSALARGQRLLDDRLRFRQQTAARIQEYRYKDMAFRIFRNDALQKYRAAFDLAALYAYLAAKAYDYETCLLPGDARGPGKNFMTDIIRSRSLGIIQNSVPMTGTGRGDPGLADPLARMYFNWSLVLDNQLGFNNPQVETGRFSLRYELFRILYGATSDTTWRTTLRSHVVTNLLNLPEFRRYCIPFSPQQMVEPGIVIPFSTTINFAQNFFCWPAGGGDNSYDSSHFATKAHSIGVWFANYNSLSGGMVNTPRVYLIPVGVDILRSPTGNLGSIREFKVLDQLVPVPYPLSLGYLLDPNWIPLEESLFDGYGKIRRYPSFRAYHDSGVFDSAETISNTRLIGRSVWNTCWLLIIPAGTLHSDRQEGLNRFIDGPLVNGVRTGQGVSDIKLFFRTYSYSGN